MLASVLDKEAKLLKFVAMTGQFRVNWKEDTNMYLFQATG